MNRAALLSGHSGAADGLLSPRPAAPSPCAAPGENAYLSLCSRKWRKLPPEHASAEGGHSLWAEVAAPVGFAATAPLLAGPMATERAPRPKFCPRSRFVFVGPSETGGTVIGAAGCNRNDCGYCGRKKALKFVDRVRLLSSQEQAAGWRVLFCTFTVRSGNLSAAASFPVVAAAVRQAIKQAQEPKAGQKWRGAAGRAWSGCTIKRVSSVDVTAAGFAHRHDLLYVKARPGRRLPSDKSLRRRLWYYYSRALCRLLRLPGGFGANSPGFVDVRKSTGPTAAALYMGLHNGKVWEGENKYPPRCRRLSSSPGFLPHLPKAESSGWHFVKRSVSAAVCGLADAGVSMAATGPASITAAASISSKAILRHVFGYRTITTPRPGPLDPEVPAAIRHGLNIREYRAFLEGGCERLARLCLPGVGASVALGAPVLQSPWCWHCESVAVGLADVPAPTL
jgi:hypothetical protein